LRKGGKASQQSGIELAGIYQLSEEIFAPKWVYISEEEILLFLWIAASKKGLIKIYYRTAFLFF